MAVKIGIIGAGSNGRGHAQAAKNAGFEVVAIADVNEASAKDAAKTLGIAHAFGNPADLLALKEVDGVIISVPNKFHKPTAVAAMEAGKDVLVEKPMALNRAECREMIDTAKKHKRILQIGFVNRLTTSSVAAKELIDAGRLGNVYHVKANYYRRRGIPGLGGWFTTKALSGGGPLIDLGVHIIDLVMYMLDFPTPKRVSGKVYASFGKDMKKYVFENMWAGPPRYDGVCDVEDSAHALIRLDGGVTFEMNTTWAGNFPEGSMNNLMGFFGDKGGITFQLGGKEVKLATEEHGHNVDIVPNLRPRVQFEDQVRLFASNIETRTEPAASGERGLIVQAIIDAIFESSEKDQEVEIKL